MSFRARLLVFFVTIVVVPMGAVALMLFNITSQSELGKADARIAEGLRVAVSVYQQDRTRALPELRRVTRDPALTRALDAGNGAAASKLLAGLLAKGSAHSIVLYDEAGRQTAAAGPTPPLAPALAAPADSSGKQFGSLAVSTTDAKSFADAVGQLTGLDVRVFSGGRRLASTLAETDAAATPKSGKVKLGGASYRERFTQFREPVGAPVSIGVLTPSEGISSSISNSRTLIGIILFGCLGLALVLSVFIVRALQGQIGEFLNAARRLGRGDFSQPVPTHGRDEFAALGDEFNKMSEELAAKIEEVERKRRELEETIRRVGEAFAAGLDRQELLDLAVRQAVEACEADAGRAVPIDPKKMHRAYIGDADLTLVNALEAAEKGAFAIVADVGVELLANLDPGREEQVVEQRRPTAASVDGVHALAGPLRARVDGGSDVNYVGVLSIARRGRDFTETETDMFGYLAAQAAVSVENANLHETVQRQAVTDELTGLFNVRHFQDFLEHEIDRSRRFNSPVGLAMLDIDNFKKVNDTYGHQQGDLVLVEVARAMRSLSRDIDEPARYGGEELAVVLPQTDLDGAALLAERMRAKIEALEIQRLDGGGVMKITASFGVASIPRSADGRRALIAAADAALYRAKHGGKNRVERAEAVGAAS